MILMFIYSSNTFNSNFCVSLKLSLNNGTCDLQNLSKYSLIRKLVGILIISKFIFCFLFFLLKRLIFCKEMRSEMITEQRVFSQEVFIYNKR